MADREAPLHHLLDALAADRPAAAERARAWLQEMLADILAADEPEVAWRSGALTGDGYPVDFTFTTADDDIRCTVEPWPDVPPAGRLDRAMAVVGDRSGEIRRVQPDGAALRYGAWVGARFGAQPAADRLKLYAEITSTAAHPDQPMFSDLPVEPRIEAVEPASGRRERYYRGHGVHQHHVGQLLLATGQPDRTAETWAFLESAYGHVIDGPLPGGAAGWSIATTPGGTSVLTIFLFAPALWGRDRRIARRAKELCRSAHLNLAGYAAAVDSLPESEGARTRHGMVGFVVAPEQPIHLALGLRPPPVPARVGG